MDKTMNILITGGTGMVGSAFKQILPNAFYPTRQELYSILRDKSHEEGFCGKNIIHLAAKVGGVKANLEQMADFYAENSSLNQASLSRAHLGQAKKVISLLSTCIYPDAPYINYPLTEEQLHLGPPHHSNFGYAYSKRMVDVMSRAYRLQHGCNFITAIPNNLYGENDNFDLENSHVIPALIRKIWEAKINNKPYVECWGDGSPQREFTYSEDIVKILLFLMENYNDPEPINIGNTEEHSIKEVVEIICQILGYDGEIKWQLDKPSGQFRKPSCNKKLLDLGWSKKDYTSLQIGLQKTCKWFIMHYPNIRGI
jgi:GDP-L-fucose synthase